MLAISKDVSWPDGSFLSFFLLVLHSGHTGLGNSFVGKCLNEGGFVALGVDELVVQNLDIGVLSGKHDDLVGDSLGIGKGGNVLANTSEGKLDAFGVGSLELSLALLTNDDEVKRLGDLIGVGTNASTEARVNTTAKTLVGRADDDEGLLLLRFGSNRLGGFEDLVGSLTILARLGHGTLSTGELGRRNDLHCAGNLLDVANRLQAAFDFTKGRVGGSSIGASSRSSKDKSLVSKTSSPHKYPSNRLSFNAKRCMALTVAVVVLFRCESSGYSVQISGLCNLLNLPHRSCDRSTKSRTSRPRQHRGNCEKTKGASGQR